MSFKGKIVYSIYYRPLSWLKQVRQCGGIVNFILIEKGKKNMAKSAQKLHIKKPSKIDANVYFLTGKKFWPLTAFCMYSLVKVCNNTIRPVFIDDGTLDKELIKKIKTQFPDSIVKTKEQIEVLVNELLPPLKYPHINKKRTIYPHIKKLTDIHVGSTGWKMVLDSDMLFFKHPTQVINWLKNPQQPFFLFDPICSYHYSINLMEQLSGHTIVPNLNVGAVGLKSELINWDKLEQWIGQLEGKEGTSYLLEQALSAMLVAGQPILVADKMEYIVMPDKQEATRPTAILYHYVATSKQWYYKQAWKKV
ncbi:hypothetical protein [Mucilaginibacter sp.]|uniref:hypothetical protein n=1 Tax=Mucilaginibacter sp. TaxID=1882438 RepID=UPI0026326ECD|nr:hypothetical protein [Mucilaginibacter sp.]MDB4927014.1 glycosyl transferase [Mucilaginibacter sp.]